MYTKMKEKNKNLNEELEIPEEIKVSIERNEIVLKKDEKEIRRKLNDRVEVKLEGNKILLSSKKATKREKKILYTLRAHIKNAFEGLTKGFKYKLKAVSVHFPMTLEIDKEKNQMLIKNFLGEKKPRVVNLISGVEIKINKDEIEIKSEDIEKAGQMAANIEKMTKVKKRDRRVFQDGIYIIEKPGVVYLE